MVLKTRSAREERLLRTVSEILSRCGARLPASEGEAKCASYMHERFAKANLEVEIQPVSFAPYQHLPLVLGYALMVLAAIALAKAPPLAAALSILGTVVLLSEANATPTISRVLPRRSSSNVIARRPSEAAPARRLIITAHLDSAHTSLFSHPRAALIQRQAFVFAINAAGAITILSILGSITTIGTVWWVGLAAGLYLIFHLTVLVHSSLDMPASPGANDDASGLAVLAELAEQLPPLRHTEVWLVATCGHEANLAGMRAFLQAKRPADLPNTLLINLESVGAGSLGLSLVEGYLRASGVSRQLLQAAAIVARDEKLQVQGRPYQNENTEAYLALRSGLPAVSMVGFDRRGAVPNWHWRTDSVENLEPATMDLATRLTEGIILRLDAAVAVPAAGQGQQI